MSNGDHFCGSKFLQFLGRVIVRIVSTLSFRPGRRRSRTRESLAQQPEFGVLHVDTGVCVGMTQVWRQTVYRL